MHVFPLARTRKMIFALQEPCGVQRGWCVLARVMCERCSSVSSLSSLMLLRLGFECAAIVICTSFIRSFVRVGRTVAAKPFNHPRVFLR